ncbi:hypothetical protein [Arenimonas sp. MALMAid1274]|uniref:hypothetical protein n=1 Tax=Arenimonas sp. MALMAid1274 TaxID=3411630 RepID=UPI003BA0FD01
MPRWIWIFLLACIGALLWAANRSPDLVVAQSLSGQGLVNCVPQAAARAGEAPMQSDVPDTMGPFRHGEFTITPLAGFALQARVLAREDYRFDAGAALSPTDLALGWQRMSDPAVYRQLSISQSGRWYHYRWGSEGPPLELGEIIRSSANMHLIPANAGVAQAMSRVRPDQTVQLQGWLVEARREDGWHWRSSLTREDSGDGSCELIYVCAISAN